MRRSYGFLTRAETICFCTVVFSAAPNLTSMRFDCIVLFVVVVVVGFCVSNAVAQILSGCTLLYTGAYANNVIGAVKQFDLFRFSFKKNTYSQWMFLEIVYYKGVR